MKNNAIVSRVLVVIMGVPITSFNVDFDGAKTMNSVNHNFCIEKIRAVLIVPFSLVYDL